MEEETSVDYKAIYEQAIAENEQLREQLADVRLRGYYKMLDGMEEIKHMLGGLHFRSFFIGYFVALGVVYLLSCMRSE